jgi:agmatinase
MKEFTHNFLGMPDIPLKNARFVVLPIPFEATTSCQKGTKSGPSDIIFSSNYLELYDEQLNIEPYLNGIKTLPSVEPTYKNLSTMVSKISRSAYRYFKENKIVIGLGGEHTVSLGIVDACTKKNKKVNVLCFDAHADLRDTYEGTKFSHACVTRRIAELGCNIFSAGIRSISKEEKSYLDASDRIKILWAYQMKGKQWIESLNNTLPSGTYYISFDVDFLDPSVFPETGTPEPGGFQWDETINFLKTFIHRKDVKIAGFDVVELSSSKRFTPSSFLAAKLIYKIIGFISSQE